MGRGLGSPWIRWTRARSRPLPLGIARETRAGGHGLRTTRAPGAIVWTCGSVPSRREGPPVRDPPSPAWREGSPMRDGRAAKGRECAAMLRSRPDARCCAAKGVECAASPRNRPDAWLVDLQRPPMRENGPKSHIDGPSLQFYRALEGFGRTGRAAGPMRAPSPHTQSPVARTASQRDPGASNELRCMGSIRRTIRVTIYHHRTDLHPCGLVELDSACVTQNRQEEQ